MVTLHVLGWVIMRTLLILTMPPMHFAYGWHLADQDFKGRQDYKNNNIYTVSTTMTACRQLICINDARNRYLLLDYGEANQFYVPYSILNTLVPSNHYS